MYNIKMNEYPDYPCSVGLQTFLPDLVHHKGFHKDDQDLRG